MTGIDFHPAALEDPEQVQWWNAWNRRAEAATAKALDAFETWLEAKDGTPFRLEFTSAIWTDLRDWLLKNVFHRKCAYCERRLSGYYGDAEHYRPKGAVTHRIADGSFEKPVCQFPDPVTGVALRLGHPGYFWLAYDWRNLVPACVYCNSGQGKNERFDIGKEYVVLVRLTDQEFTDIPAAARPLPSRKWPSYYYLAPAGLDTLEHPLLLNPLNAPLDRNPRKHIRFGVRGIEAAVDNSPIGVNSIETYQLSSDELRQDRQEAQAKFRGDYYDAMRRFDPTKAANSEAKTLLDEYARGQWPFSAAALDYYRILYAAQAMLAPPEP